MEIWWANHMDSHYTKPTNGFSLCFVFVQKEPQLASPEIESESLINIHTAIRYFRAVIKVVVMCISRMCSILQVVSLFVHHDAIAEGPKNRVMFPALWQHGLSPT